MGEKIIEIARLVGEEDALKSPPRCFFEASAVTTFGFLWFHGARAGARSVMSRDVPKSAHRTAGPARFIGAFQDIWI